MKLPFSRRFLAATDDLHGNYVYTTPGTYTLKLSRRTKAKIIAIGSGCDRYYSQSWLMGYSAYWVAGSGGGGFIGTAKLPAGTYSIKVGDSYHYTSYSDLDNHNHDYASTTPTSLTHNTIGTLLSVMVDVTKSENFEIVAGTVEMDSMGNLAIMSDNGGASLWNGYGKGSDKAASNYTTGYFSIEW